MMTRKDAELKGQGPKWTCKVGYFDKKYSTEFMYGKGLIYVNSQVKHIGFFDHSSDIPSVNEVFDDFLDNHFIPPSVDPPVEPPVDPPVEPPVDPPVEPPSGE